jgi:hypothetical protein
MSRAEAFFLAIGMILLGIAAARAADPAPVQVDTAVRSIDAGQR